MALIPYERQFATFGNGLLRDFFGDSFPSAASPAIKADVKEIEGEYIVEAEIPGVKKEDVELICEKGVLTIVAKTNEEKMEETSSFVRKERVKGETRRSFALKNINEELISAKLENGMLYVKLPKKAQDKLERRIEID